MLVQRTFFAPPADVAPVELYFSTERGSAIADRTGITVEPLATVSTDTYFGRFPAGYWQRWTPVTRVEVRATVTGHGRVRLMASDSDGEPRPAGSVTVATGAPETVELSSPLDRFTDGGSFWLDIRTDDAELSVSDVCWHVDGLGPRPSAVVVICTYNRADDCVTTLRTLARDAECVGALDGVFVVDQGSDPVSSRAGFTEVDAKLGGKLRYLRQPNLGGAGGFTRGMYEATSGPRQEWPHLVLMDDDIALEPDTVLRLIAFAAATNGNTIVGGQMLQLLHPNRLHVAAERADLSQLRAGRPVPRAPHNADLTEKLQDARVNAEYNAWWSCLIPPAVVAAVGYPLPFFFQWDDIEYGLRARAAGYPTVTLAGAGVWHADFAWKDWDDWSRYFSLRNALIVSALHGEFDVTGTARFLLAELWRYLVSMRYGLARTLLMAVEDFLRGPDILADGGAQAAAMVRKVRAEYPETIVHSAYGAPDLPVALPAPAPSKPGLVLLKRIAWQLVGKSRGEAAIAARHNEWWHVSLFDRVVVTDPSQEGVKVRQRDPQVLRMLARRGTKVLWRFVREAGAARARYRSALPELTSRSNWSRLFGADRPHTNREPLRPSEAG